MYEDADGSPALSPVDFEALYRTHVGRMKSVARNLLGNSTDAEDAVQEAFLKLYRSIDQFKGESLLSTFLYRILVNTCYDAGRKRQRRAESPEIEVDGAGEPVGERPDLPIRLALERGLRRLDPRPRAVFLLFEVEGFTHREVGEILGIPEGTSKHALFVAKKELQAQVLGLQRRRES
jgi:RNA polymerase sigma-70 factor (ECF subfamily)